jgi:hypothetical protein
VRQQKRTIELPDVGEASAERNQAAIRLLDAWLREDASAPAESDTWKLLKTALDRDRPAGRKLFR